MIPHGAICWAAQCSYQITGTSHAPAFSSRSATSGCLSERRDWVAAVWPRAIRVGASQTSGLPQAAVIQQL